MESRFKRIRFFFFARRVEKKQYSFVYKQPSSIDSYCTNKGKGENSLFCRFILFLFWSQFAMKLVLNSNFDLIANKTNSFRYSMKKSHYSFFFTLSMLFLLCLFPTFPFFFQFLRFHFNCFQKQLGKKVFFFLFSGKRKLIGNIFQIVRLISLYFFSTFFHSRCLLNSPIQSVVEHLHEMRTQQVWNWRTLNNI